MNRAPTFHAAILWSFLAVAVVVQAGVMPTVARADNFGSSGTAGTDDPPGSFDNGVWLTNNNNLIVYKRSLSSNYSNGVDRSMLDDYDTVSGFSATPVSATGCTNSGADVCVYDHDYDDNGYNGWNQCAVTPSGSHPNQVCGLAKVKINLYYSPHPKRIACHEIGHATGLRHTMRTYSCLKRSIDGGTATTLSGPDRDHLRIEY